MKKIQRSHYVSMIRTTSAPPRGTEVTGAVAANPGTPPERRDAGDERAAASPPFRIVLLGVGSAPDVVLAEVDSSDEATLAFHAAWAHHVRAGDRGELAVRHSDGRVVLRNSVW